ncbi:hypothetical protein HK405_015699, partial [Cladochytrium tenue]
LFDLSMEYDEVVGILVRQLSEAIATRRKAGPSEALGAAAGAGAAAVTGAAETAAQAAAARAAEVLDYYAGRPAVLARVSEGRRQAAHVLARLNRFADEHDAGRLEAALEALRSTGLLPLEQALGPAPTSPGSSAFAPTSPGGGGSMSVVATRWADGLARLDPAVARCLPQVFLLAMSTLSGLYHGAQGGGGGGAASPVRLGAGGSRQAAARQAELRALARDVVLCAGTVQYRVPADVYARLTRLE